MQLQLAMEERRHEVEVQRDLLRAELKAVTEDMHKTVLEKKERGIKVAKVRGRETEGFGGDCELKLKGAMGDMQNVALERQERGTNRG